MIAQSVTLFAKRRSRWCETGVAGGPPAVPEGDGSPAGSGWCDRRLCSSRWSFGRLLFAQGFAGEGELVRGMDDPVENGVGKRGVVEIGMPMLDR